MSDFKWNAGNGGIFTNKKEKDGQPDSKGELTCPCCEKSLELAAWRKEGNKGPWLSLSAKEKGSFKPKEKQARQDYNDDLPQSDIPF